MTLEKRIADWKAGVERVPWDAVQERRVLARIRADRRETRAPLSRGRLLGAAAFAAVAVVAMLTVYGIAPGPAEPAFDRPEGPDTSPTTQTGTGRFKFPDGSIATYLTPAVVEVEEQSPESIRLDHLHGQVRYQVVPRPGRSFVVNANGIEVQVVGTVFVVDVDLVDVRVKVDRGMVVVDSGSGIVELSAGEEIVLACRDGVEVEPLLAPDAAEGASLSVAIEAAERAPLREDARNGPTFDQLLREVDRARRAGDNERAATTLKQLISSYPGNGRIVSVLFTLGKVESQRGRYVEAARAFGKCWRSSPRGTLAEDAHFQEAIAWDRIGRIREAQGAARRYLESFPNGPYAERMRRLAQ
jgi:hypothetical protein